MLRLTSNDRLLAVPVWYLPLDFVVLFGFRWAVGFSLASAGLRLNVLSAYRCTCERNQLNDGLCPSIAMLQSPTRIIKCARPESYAKLRHNTPNSMFNTNTAPSPRPQDLPHPKTCLVPACTQTYTIVTPQMLNLHDLSIVQNPKIRSWTRQHGNTLAYDINHICC